MGSSASLFTGEASYTGQSSQPISPERRNAKYGEPPPPFSKEFRTWESNYIYNEGTLMKKIRRDSNNLRIRILLDVKLQFLQKTIVIIYCPHLSLTYTLTKYIEEKLQFSLISLADYSSHQEMYKEIVQNQKYSSGCLFYNFPTNSSEVAEFNDRTIDYRKIVIIFDFDLMKLSRSKFSQWIHTPSRRIYDDEICPPQQVLINKNAGIAIEDSAYLDDITKEPLQKIDGSTAPEIQKYLKQQMKMIMDMRTHYAYCANPISINPHITPGSSLSKYKREIVMTLCNYISHQTKPPPRDLNTLHSAAANYALDSQIVAVGPDQGAVLAELNQSSPRNEVVAGEQISNSGESLPHSKPRKVVLSSTPSLPDPTIRPTELNIVSTFTHLSPKASDVGKNPVC